MKLQKLLLTLTLFGTLSSITNADEKYGNLLECPYTDLTSQQNAGQSFLTLIQKKIRPELNKNVTDGYSIVNGEWIVEALNYVDSKVKRGIMRSVKGQNTNQKLENLRMIGNKLEGKITNLHTLPQTLASTGLVKDRYKLSTYVGLASCGGSTIKLAADNYAYNIHYGTGSEKKDKQTGRSFGASRVFHATDSSYTHYLKTLQSYATKTPQNIKSFMTTIMETLTNSDTRSYENVNDKGDAVLTDFFAIWTAEQTRNLMDRRVDLHWDAALLQVTLLSAFHAGQDKIKLFYKDPLTGKSFFTDTTYKLAWPKKDHANETCNVNLESRKLKDASLKDYIGVHYRTYEHCGRSGINMSRNEWKKLSREITAYLMRTEEGRMLVAGVRKHLGKVIDLTKSESGKKYYKNRHDIFRELARFLINSKTPAQISYWEELSKNTAKLLEYVRVHANDITETIEEKYSDSIQ